MWKILEVDLEGVFASVFSLNLRLIKAKEAILDKFTSFYFYKRLCKCSLLVLCKM